MGSAHENAMRRVPASRIRKLVTSREAANPRYVLYWMTSARRTKFNFGLQRAVEACRQFKLPLVILEGLRCDYQWASDRLHAFVIEGMQDNELSCRRYRGVTYLSYLESRKGEGKGLLEELSKAAAVVVTDDFPCFFLPRMLAAASRQVQTRMEAVDSNGLLPLSACDGRTFTVAHSFRRHLHKVLWDHIDDVPYEYPLHLLPDDMPEAELDVAGLARRWTGLRAGAPELREIQLLPIDHDVFPVADDHGGMAEASLRLEEFMALHLPGYGSDRNDPDLDATTRLSAHLHFGHISVHEIFARVGESQRWTIEKVNRKQIGKRQGWWGMRADAESLLDELITWREIGYNMCHTRRDYADYDSLPDFARLTLEEHQSDPRPAIYSLEQLDQAQTSDPIWNAAQRELVATGRIHNTVRMIWGKRVLEWTHDPRTALAYLIELNNRYALDGRNPNSYSGIFWCFGRYDRAWGPERPIYGKVRYMSSALLPKKVKMKEYLGRWGQGDLFAASGKSRKAKR